MGKIDELIKELCPDGVEYRTLSDLGTFYGGLSGKSKKDFTDGNAKFISYMNIFSNPSVNLDIEDSVVINENEKQNSIQYKDVLFTGSSETPDECGMSSVVTEELREPFYLNSFSFGFRLTNKSLFDKHFLKHYFRGYECRKAIAKTANGVTRFNISKTKFGKIQIPLPPLSIQQQIVEILDTFTDSISNLQEELELREKQMEYYRESLLSFDAEEVEWDYMGEVYDMKAGKSIHSSEIFQNQSINYKYPCYGGNGLRGYVGIYNQVGEKVIIGRQGALCGNVCYVNNTFYATEHAVVVSEKGSFISKFSFYLLKKMDLNKYKTSGAQPGLSVSRLEKIQIPVPSLSRQQEIVDILDTFESMIANIKEEIALRQKQYEYYREKLLTFERKEA